jgi:hypothetical protein
MGLCLLFWELQGCYYFILDQAIQAVGLTCTLTMTIQIINMKYVAVPSSSK